MRIITAVFGLNAMTNKNFFSNSIKYSYWFCRYLKRKNVMRVCNNASLKFELIEYSSLWNFIFHRFVRHKLYFRILCEFQFFFFFVTRDSSRKSAHLFRYLFFLSSFGSLLTQTDVVYPLNVIKLINHER